MKAATLILFGAVSLSAASPAASQLISDEAVGTQRVCYYASATGSRDSRDQLPSYAVGLAQNCPVTYPVSDPTAPVSPTASLDSETISDEVRNCIYRQAAQTWTYTIPVTRPCPLTAGLMDSLLREQAAGRRP